MGCFKVPALRKEDLPAEGFPTQASNTSLTIFKQGEPASQSNMLTAFLAQIQALSVTQDIDPGTW